jgi:hypothetical protein
MKTTLALVLAGMLASATAFAATTPAASTAPASASAPAAATKSADDCAKRAKQLHGKKREEAMKKCAPATAG